MTYLFRFKGSQNGRKKGPAPPPPTQITRPTTSPTVGAEQSFDSTKAPRIPPIGTGPDLETSKMDLGAEYSDEEDPPPRDPGIPGDLLGSKVGADQRFSSPEKDPADAIADLDDVIEEAEKGIRDGTSSDRRSSIASSKSGGADRSDHQLIFSYFLRSSSVAQLITLLAAFKETCSW